MAGRRRALDGGGALIRLSRVAACGLLLALAGIGPRTASAEALPAVLRSGIEAYNQVDYPSALRHLRAALQQTTDSQALALAYFYVGCTHLALEQEEDARVAFETLLAFQPDYMPQSDTSPKIAAFFRRVRRASSVPFAPPILLHRPPTAPGQVATVLSLEVKNLSPCLRPGLRYRASSSPGFLARESANRSGNRFRFSVAAESGGELLYYFVLTTSDGVEVTRLGSPLNPFSLRGRRTEPVAVAWYKSWWFWTLTGAVLTGTTLGLAVGFSGEDRYSAGILILRNKGTGSSPNRVPIFDP